MRDKVMNRWSTYEPFYVLLGEKKVADIVITNHAKSRWSDRIAKEEADAESIAAFMWDCLKQERIESYYRNEQDVYLIDGDIVVVAEFAQSDQDFDLVGEPMVKMIVVTFLGKMSETMELRDLKTYYSWLRHTRRMTLVKNSRKHK
ncbi:hypothetical protein [Paenibacillus apiarius]|uniref:Periplasmic protein n=1 Tax=Paenibacillus apiarius TaxID=46240 RepID=A0ABT4DQ45_9BACL|nr:hypothetical protein [Paenibacillus apiarius]MBN3526057.1 hypothetical protein [Paenibacillus apiarius]MCY9513682.1 hypothetical protein [Paenibacillus apiarius]MCY9518233.1 hypothetical protein [Paenibacillus apiarius]MCY9551366.1 hypothetical protein [Paenibacillus apiarius]MCY9558520.1 hypothetical protein [Paenibacillus apiarius]